MAFDAISAQNKAFSGQGLAQAGGVVAGRLAPAGGKALLDGKQREFSRVLGRVNPAIQAAELGRDTGSVKAKRRQAAEDMVAISLVQPILKSVRENNNAAAPFGPGPAEKQFGVFMDAAWARSLVKSGNFQLVNSVERWLGGRSDLVGQAAGEPAAAAAVSNAAAQAAERANTPAAQAAAAAVGGGAAARAGAPGVDGKRALAGLSGVEGLIQGGGKDVGLAGSLGVTGTTPRSSK